MSATVVTIMHNALGKNLLARKCTQWILRMWYISTLPRPRRLQRRHLLPLRGPPTSAVLAFAHQCGCRSLPRRSLERRQKGPFQGSTDHSTEGSTDHSNKGSTGVTNKGSAGYLWSEATASCTSEPRFTRATHQGTATIPFLSLIHI